MRRTIIRGFGHWMVVACVMAVVAGCGGGGEGGDGLVLPFCYPKHYKRACYGGDVYWYDSCDGREDKYQECGAGVCSNARCEVQLTWARTYGAFGDQYPETASSIEQTADGGYIVSGITYFDSEGLDDWWVLKLDAYGDKVWEKTFGGADDDAAVSARQTPDGGYVVAGYKDAQFYNMPMRFGDYWIIKLDSSGNEVWNKVYGGEAIDLAASMELTADGGCVVAGDTSSYGEGYYDFWVMKLDSTGEKEWDKTFGGTGFDYANSVQQTTDGGYILAGSTSSSVGGDRGIWIIKLDPGGNKSWENTIGGPDDESANSIVQTADGGYIVAGYTESWGAGESDFWILKLDTSGEEVWSKTFGGTGGDYAQSIRQTTDGGFIVAGYTESYGAGEYDIWVLKLDASGNKLWEKTFGEEYDDVAFSIRQTSDGGYALGGYTTSSFGFSVDMWVIKLDSGGNCDGCFE